MYGKEKNIAITVKTNVDALSLETMVQLGIMINELITNSIKYAFIHNTKGNIFISLSKEREEYTFVYADDGKGIKEADETKNSLGLKLIRLTAKQLQGKLLMQNSNGLQYTIRFKDDTHTHTDC